MPLTEATKTQAAARLGLLPNPVRLIAFGLDKDCPFCTDNRGLAEEVVALAPGKLTLEVRDFASGDGETDGLRVERVPAIAILGEKDYGIRFYGVPAGFEFTALVAALELVGSRDSFLRPETRERLKALTTPVDLKVFTTLTCPICPLAVNVAHRLAVESDFVTASAIDTAEFPNLVKAHAVLGVPKVVINNGHSFEGALPEDRFVEEVLKGATA